MPSAQSRSSALGVHGTRTQRRSDDLGRLIWWFAGRQVEMSVTPSPANRPDTGVGSFPPPQPEARERHREPKHNASHPARRCHDPGVTATLLASSRPVRCASAAPVMGSERPRIRRLGGRYELRSVSSGGSGIRAGRCGRDPHGHGGDRRARRVPGEPVEASPRSATDPTSWQGRGFATECRRDDGLRAGTGARRSSSHLGGQRTSWPSPRSSVSPRSRAAERVDARGSSASGDRIAAWTREDRRVRTASSSDQRPPGRRTAIAQVLASCTGGGHHGLGPDHPGGCLTGAGPESRPRRMRADRGEQGLGGKPIGSVVGAGPNDVVRTFASQ